ncbi:hypothetical protein M422DRAFT_32986 [Sphaerobolus stellatus SS14]|uniref:Uncharacterized protein n=1 Tax=Sphaerobolus stellatus (strain SS14) TaxID=990650 RepID=A0A0C9VBN1_SPHS4|nr:hypothetical protein M422DRAFT_32986 [Sphaerobolus stellatus SS14]
MSPGIQELMKELSTRQPLPSLAPPGVYSSDTASAIEGLDVGKGVKAALHLLNDDINRCHNIAQSNEGVPTFDYLHAVLHRREQDCWNSKWWFNRISHPLIKELYRDMTPQKFVDEVEKAVRTQDKAKLEILAERQMQEMVKLAEYAMENEL